MVNPSHCYLCGQPIERDQASVAIPRLTLRLHLSCYERDMGASQSATPPDARRTSLAQALVARPSKRRAG